MIQYLCYAFCTTIIQHLFVSLVLVILDFVKYKFCCWVQIMYFEIGAWRVIVGTM